MISTSLNGSKLVGDPVQVNYKVIELTDKPKSIAAKFLKETEIRL